MSGIGCMMGNSQRINEKISKEVREREVYLFHTYVEGSGSVVAEKSSGQRLRGCEQNTMHKVSIFSVSIDTSWVHWESTTHRGLSSTDPKQQGVSLSPSSAAFS